MKFVVDAQLPYRLKDWLIQQGFDAIHTSDLPEQNLTRDLIIIQLAEDQDRIVITKDNDFLAWRVLRGTPKKLLMITTGNIVNKDLITLFERNFDEIIKLFKQHSLIEMDNFVIMTHAE